MEISIVIPTHNKKAELRRCLEAVLAQQFDGEFEVLVCDDGSSDGTADRLEAWRRREPRLRYLRQSPRGPAAARNLGIRQARAPLIAMTDDDAVPDPRWLQRLAEAARQPGVAGVEGRVTAGRPLGPCETAPVNETGGVYLTCNALYRRDALVRAGGFDERFPFPAFEDCDLAARIRELGEIAWAPDAVVVHPPRPLTWRGVLRRLRHLPWVMVIGRRYGYLGWPRFPTRHPRARVIWNAVAALPAGRLLAALRALASFPAQGLRAALYALTEPFAALFAAVPALFRFDLESAAFHLDSLGLAPDRPPAGLVIVNTRKPDVLAHCLRSFAPVPYPGLRTIVVANAALPEQVEPLRRQFPGVDWVVSGENLGYAGGNNLGIARALETGCRYVLVMNDDTECIAPDFLERMVDFLERNPAVALAGPRVYLRRRGDVQNTVLRYPSPLRNFRDWFGYRLFPARYQRSGDSVRPAEMLNGVCVMLRADALRQVGSFDPRFFIYVEDADLGLRLRKSGWQIAYLPFDSIVHLQQETGYDLYGWVSLLLRRNAVYFLLKHRRSAQAWTLAAANVALAAGRTCLAFSAQEFRRRLDFTRALWRAFRAVLKNASWEPQGSWRPSAR